MLILALTIAVYGAVDSQLDESSDNSIRRNERGRITFASIIVGVRAIHMIR